MPTHIDHLGLSTIPQLAQWCFSPGKNMHASWWQHLGIGSWASYYGRNPILDRQLDALIRKRTLLPHYRQLIFPMTEIQQGVLRMWPRLPSLLICLGILLLECPDYLLRREYRLSLNAAIGESTVDQLWMLWRGGKREPLLSADELILNAQQWGYSALYIMMENDLLWPLLRLQLPASFSERNERLFISGECLWIELRRLERLL